MSLLLFVAAAHAAGFYVPDSGVRALGRGGAFTAGVDDLSALYWNPAGLARLTGPTAALGLTGVSQLVTFDRADSDELAFDPVHNHAPPFVVPQVAVGTRYKAFGLAFGVTTPSAPLYRYPADGAQRAILVASTLERVDVGPQVAWSAGPVALGIGAAWSVFAVDQTLASSIALGGSDDPRYDVTTRIRGVDAFTPTGSAGVVVAPIDRLRIGASVQPPVTYHAKGSLSTDFTANAFYTGDGFQQTILEPVAVDDDVTVPIRLPMVARAGVEVHPVEALAIELDGVYERWRTFREERVTDMDLVIQTVGDDDILVTDDIVLPTPLDDAWSARAGVEWTGARYALRGGALFEASAADPTRSSVAIPDGPKAGGTAGVSAMASRGWTFDLGFGCIVTPRRELDRSIVTQVAIDPQFGTVQRGGIVGRGTLSATDLLLGAAVRWSPPRRAIP
jgi:long-chain fatty acid transport protein